MKIALISDTHIPPAPGLPPQLVEHLRQADLILYTGRITEALKVLIALRILSSTIHFQRFQ